MQVPPETPLTAKPENTAQFIHSFICNDLQNVIDFFPQKNVMIDCLN